jgi:hypothetical protein
MSTYKIQISKNLIARASDSNITYQDSDTGTEDIKVTLFVDDTEIHAVTLTDEGSTLQYTGTLTEGYHTIKVVPEAGKPTDVHVDRILIDDSVVVGSQYLIDTRIFNKADDFFMFKSCKPFRSPKETDHVWWGQIFNSDYSINSFTSHYRPHIVTDLGQWWEWSFSVTAAGHIHWSIDDSDSILYDSTENHIYYAAKSLLYTDSSAYPSIDASQIPNDSTVGVYEGPATYNENFVNVSDSLDLNTYFEMPIYSEAEWQSRAWYYLFYYTYSNIDPIVIS